MEISKEIKSKLISYLLSKGIDRVNAKTDVISKIKEAMCGEDRTILLKIREFDTMGFGIEFGRLVKYDNIEKPTVTVILSEDCFIQLVRGSITFREAFCYGDCDVTGNSWLRDIVVFSAIFDEFRSISSEFGL